MNENRLLLEAFAQAQKKSIPCALATVVHVTGSSYRQPGAKMLITAGGEIFGSVSGGCLERDLIKRALTALQSSKRQIVRYDTSRDADDDDQEALIRSAGLGCEGVITIFIDSICEDVLKIMARVQKERVRTVLATSLSDENFFRKEIISSATKSFFENGVFYDVLSPAVPWIIFGAGHDAIAMTRMAHEIGWEVSVVDCRSSFSIPKRFFALADQIIQCEPEQVSKRINLESATIMAILMTHNYEHDKTILKQLLPHSIKYIGILGPKSRSEKMLKELENLGLNIDAMVRSRLHFPVGLDLGGEGPAAIALSVLSEAQSILNNRKAAPLRDRPGSIHDISQDPRQFSPSGP